jgi:hypothetical protein
MVPALIRYTEDLPSHAGGTASWFVVRIRPKYRQDKGLHAHELLHVAQWWVATIVSAVLIAGVCWHFGHPFWWVLASPLVFDLLYSYVHPFAVWCEVKCYQEQAKHYADDRMAAFAKFMSTKYHFDISYDRALRLLNQ